MIEIQLAGGETNRYDQIYTVEDATRGPQSGSFFAGGTLRVTLAEDYKPREQAFKIFDYIAFHGEFDAIELPALSGDWDTRNLSVDGTIFYQPPPEGTMILLR